MKHKGEYMYNKPFSIVREHLYDIVTIILFFLIALVFFGADRFVEFATDTYVTAAIGWHNTAVDSIARNGRWVIAAFYELWNAIGSSIDSFYYFSFGLAIICLTMALFVLFKMINKVVNSILLSAIISTSILLNPFSIEYFMFFEKGMFFLGLLFGVLSAYCYVRFIEEKKYKLLFYSFIFELLTVFTYQPIGVMLVCLSIPFIFQNSKDCRKCFVDLCGSGLVFGISGIINLVTLKLLGSPRVGSQLSLYEKLSKMLTLGIRFIKETSGILPKYSFLIIVVLIFAITTMVGLANGRFKSGLFKQTVLLAGVLFCSVFLAFIGDGSFEARTSYCIGSIPGLLLLNYLINISNKQEMNWVTICTSLLVVCLLIVQYFSFQKIISDKQTVSAKDKDRINMIGLYIDEYEKSTGNTISNVSIYRGNGITYPQYEGMFHYGSLVESSFEHSWSDVNAINYHLGKSYTRTAEDPEIAEKFMQNDDHVFSSDQMIFDGDTLHLLVY